MSVVSIKIKPLTKIVFYLVVFALIFLSQNIIHLILIFSLIISLVLSSTSHRKYILKSIAYMSPMFILAFILWSIFYNFSLFHKYSGGGFMIDLGIFMTLRLFLIISTSLLFISTVSPRELIIALRDLRLPYKMVFTLGLTLRHISTFSEEYMIIKEAQTSRGLELDKGFLIKRIKNYVPVLIPLLIRSIENAEKLSLAMDLKLFSLDKRPSKLSKSIDRYNVFLILIFLLFLGIFCYIIWV